jgi:hypothetical protein
VRALGSVRKPDGVISWNGRGWDLLSRRADAELLEMRALALAFTYLDFAIDCEAREHAHAQPALKEAA